MTNEINKLISYGINQLRTFSLITLIVIILLDVAATAVEFTIGGINFTLLGLSTPLVIFAVGVFDLGLGVLGFIITFFLEMAQKRGVKNSLAHAIIAGILLILPWAIFTILATGLKVGIDIVDRIKK